MGGPMLDFGKYKDEWGIVTALKNIVNLQLKKIQGFLYSNNVS